MKLDKFTIEMLKAKDDIGVEIYSEMAKQLDKDNLDIWYEFLEIYLDKKEKNQKEK